MNIVAMPLPVAGLWMLIWMLGCAVLFAAIFPFILRHRRRREQRELHEKIEKAREDILADGVVSGPKGPRVPHKPWGVGMTGRTPREGAPRGRSYQGGPWPS